MGVLSDFFVAEPATVPEYDCGPDFPEEDRCQFKRITPLEAAAILSVLRGVDDRIAVMNEFEFLTPQDAEQWTLSVPTDMTETLAGLDSSSLGDVATKCADVTATELGWSQEDWKQVIEQLSVLAKRAVETNRTIYLWMSL